MMTTTPKLVFFDGSIVPYSEAKIGLMTHGLHYGTGVFGGIRGYWNDKHMQMYLFRPFDHYERFLNSAKLLRMQLPYTKEKLTQETCELIQQMEYRENVYIRPLAFYGDEIIGVRLHNLTPRVAILVVPFKPAINTQKGAHVTVSSWRRVDDNIIPARGKVCGAYVNSALAKTDAYLSGFDEAIVLDNSGHVAEGSAENVFILRHGVFVTPPITENILEGITRRTLIHLIQNELGVQVQERSIDRTELFLAEEMFLCGTGVQIIPVTQIDHRPVGSGAVGPLTHKLMELYGSVVAGNVESYASWLHAVY
ncbi:MAG: branched-chain amino acid transaminase [Bacteroidetes bacterium]|nr:branched-chain amino acid transaminase [Bacteroidota bacterium]